MSQVHHCFTAHPLTFIPRCNTYWPFAHPYHIAPWRKSEEAGLHHALIILNLAVLPRATCRVHSRDSYPIAVGNPCTCRMQGPPPAIHTPVLGKPGLQVYIELCHSSFRFPSTITQPHYHTTTSPSQICYFQPLYPYYLSASLPRALSQIQPLPLVRRLATAKHTNTRSLPALVSFLVTPGTRLEIRLAALVAQSL